jgi:polysaccharide deacetylase 2 family uncharacterized protein YibQ
VPGKRPSKSKPKKGRGRLAVIWVMGMVLAFGAGYLWRSSGPDKKPPTISHPPFEEKIPRETAPLPEEPSARRTPPSGSELPLVAIVIDDLGYQRHKASDFIEVDLPLTLSFLPQAPFSKEMAREAHEKGKEVLLHLPMEPKAFPETDPGPGALLTQMTDQEIQSILEKDLEAFPWVSGVNNHMGSRFTEDRDKMAVVLKVIKGKKLYFLDSRTTPQSVVLSVASQVGVKAIHRDIFLDNVLEGESIGHQIDQLIRLAQERGSAIACGHPYPQTLQAIRKKISELKDKVRLVPLSQVLKEET